MAANKTKKALVPKLRFKGFDSELILTKFDKVVESNLYGPRFNAEDYSENGNVKTIRGTDLGSDGEIKYNQVPLARLDKSTIANHKLLDGDIIMITTADCGLTGVFRKQEIDYLSSAYGVRIRLNEQGNPYYFKYFFQTRLAKKEINSFIRKATVANLPGSDILKIKLHLPTLPEQQKIAAFLFAVDEKIQQLTRKKELLEQYKKGVMQQLLTGKLRFKDSNGKAYPKWEEKRLGALIDFINGKGHEQSIDENGKYIVVNSKFVSTGGRTKKYCKSQISPLNKGDIVMVMSDVPNGKALAKCYLIETDNLYTLNQRICALKKKNSVNEFLIYLINRHEFYLSFDSGVGQTNLKKEDVLNCPLLVPNSIEEQQKIAAYLSSIDSKIEFVSKQITQTQTFKKGLLQQMFV